MNDINKELGNRIRSFRLQRKMTIEDLANKVGIATGTMQKYEVGSIKRVDIDKLKEFAKALDVKPEQLMGWSVKWEVPDSAKNTIEKYMLLTESQRTLVDNLIDGLLSDGPGYPSSN